MFPIPIAAADTPPGNGDASAQKQKIVAMVYDNSGSMYGEDWGNPNLRSELAEYSARILMSVLDERDQMFVMPMNVNTVGNSWVDASVSDKISVDLSRTENGGRQSATDEVFFKSQYFRDHTTDAAYGMTPGDNAIENAIDLLCSEYGLQDNGNTMYSDPDKDYWLIVLTDGEFTDVNTEASVRGRTSSYSETLNTVYLNLEDGTEIPKLYDRFYSYNATANLNSERSIVSVIQKISNLISGRYTLPETVQDGGKTVKLYEVNGKKLTINLKHLKFPIASLGVLAQNCGGALDGVPVCSEATPKDVRPIRIETPGDLTSIKDACFSMIRNHQSGNEYTYFPNAGTITLTYTENIDVNNLSIFVEPALSLEMLLYKDEKAEQPISVDDIAKEFGAGETVYVGYRVKNQADGSAVKLTDSFEGVTATLSYAGQTKNFTFTSDGAPVPIALSLSSGVNDVSIAVTAKQGTAEYILRDNRACIIPTTNEYRATLVTTDSDSAFDISTFEADAVYRVTMKNGSDISDDEWTALVRAQAFHVIVTSPSGKAETFRLAASQKGLVAGKIKAFDGAGDYAVAFFIAKADMNVSHSVTMKNTAFYIEGGFGENPTVNGTTLTSAGAYTVMDGDGNPIPKSELEANYKISASLTYGETTTDLPCTIRDDGTVDVMLKAEEGRFGRYTVKLTVTSGISGEEQTSEPAEIAYYPAALILTPSAGLSMYQHELDGNADHGDYTITYTLSAKLSASETVDFAFDNGLTEWQLYVDGALIASSSDYDPTTLMISGNVLTFLPTTSALGGGVGAKDVKLVVRCAEKSELDTEASVKVDVKKTIYVIKAITGYGNSAVDRFHLSETDAAVYFYVCRMEGDTEIPLDMTQLKQRIGYAVSEDGTVTADGIEIKAEKMGVFNSNIFSPTDVRVGEPIMIDGVAAVPVTVYRDWIKCFDSYISMLVFSGEKPVTLTLLSNDVSGTTTLDYVKSPWYGYAIRIFIMVLVAYLILYLIGFLPKFAVQMPKGRFVSVSPGTTSASKKSFNHKLCPINLNFWAAFHWHLIRLIPFGSLIAYGKPWFWHAQPPKSFPVNGLELEHGKEGTFNFRVKSGIVYKMQFTNTGAAGAEFTKYRQQLAKGNGRARLVMRSSDIAMIFRKASVTPVQQNATASAKGIYGIYDKKGTLKRVIFFVQQH